MNQTHVETMKLASAQHGTKVNTAARVATEQTVIAVKCGGAYILGFLRHAIFGAKK
jgi:hypothetical protein